MTPVNNPVHQAVQLAQLSEALGFDLVTFQDHPYQASFHDTWTLMSWVAAVTDRIHLSGNVLNLPLRQPAVLARSVASLDLLSGGRIELGLGAGGFWDAIEAMGGQKLTPGQGVDALSEAIDVIRGIWDSGDRTPLRAGGQYHSAAGAKRGPSPAHEVPIWIGALKPRMLRLIGTKGDGWLPSLPYLKPGDLAAGNATIDQAAADAGRDPREIRRLLNVGGSMASDEMIRLALEEGISTFIIMGDDPAAMQRFAELLPDVRDAVAAERASRGTPQGRVRNETALSKRRDGIDYDAVPASLRDGAIEPGDSNYARSRNNYVRGGAPGIILRPADTAQVVDAVGFANAHRELPLGIRSAGHGFSGRSTNDGGIVIDLARLNSIEVMDESTRRVRIGPGARWSEVAVALQPHGWALTSGDYGGVGVGGIGTAGGIGFLAREHGLTIDHLRAAEIVVADGRVLRLSETENAELFWAVRGAGGNVGVVTSLEFEVDQVGDVGWAQLAFDASDTADFLEQWGALVEVAPRDLTAFLMIGRSSFGQPTIAQMYAVVDSDDPDLILERLQPFAALAPLVQQSIQVLPYSAVMNNVQSAEHHGQGEPVGRSGLLDHFTPESARSIARLLESGEAYVLSIRSVGGAVADLPPDATAYAHRDANFSVVALGSNRARLDAQWDTLVHHHMEGLYLSFETDPRPERLLDAFPPATLERLRAVKARFDPHNLFHDNFSVGTAALANVGSR